MKLSKAPGRSLQAALTFSLAFALCLVASHRAYGQAAAPAATQPAAAAPAAAEEETVALSKFVVSAEEDKGTYQATSSLAGTRVRTDLRDIASAISVVTEQFLIDTAATDNQSLLVYTANTEVSGLYGNFSGDSGQQTYVEVESLIRPSNTTRVRGLDRADNTRDYFRTDIPWDSFNVGRVDISRGPNAILFGQGSPAGIINNSVNTATFTNAYKVENRVDGRGGFRLTADLNHVLLPNELSVRVASLVENKKFRQKPAFNDTERYFGALKYEPKWFGEGNKTTIRLNAEYGNVTSNNPRTLPPVDTITPWFLTGTTPNGGPNLNKATFHPQNNNNLGPKVNLIDGRKLNGVKELPWFGHRIGRQDWADTVAWYGDPNNGTPSFYVSPMANQFWAINKNGAQDKSMAYPETKPLQIIAFSQYASKSSGINGVPGGRYYGDYSLKDPSIFNYFDSLLDGPNKHEWQGWNAANLAIEQSLFHDRLSLQYVYDRQRYDDGQVGFLNQAQTYRMSVDVNSHLPNGAVNPNVGRPYVANATDGDNSLQVVDRLGNRFTATADLRAEDFLGKSTLSRLLGRHVLTGLIGEDTRKVFQKKWAQSMATPDYGFLIQGGGSSGGTPLNAHIRAYDWVVYLGPTLKDASSAAGADISRVNTVIKAPKNATTTYFDSHWNKPLDPDQAGYVNPADPFVYTIESSTGNFLYGVNDPSRGTVKNETQSENPANYKGWTTTTVEFLSVDDGDIDALTSSASKRREEFKSKSFIWQGHLFDDSFVPVFGWRRDEITSEVGDGKPDPITAVATTNFQLDPKTRATTAGESKSWGAVLRLPKRISENLPLGTNVQVHYNRSRNFQAEAVRGDVFGQPLPNQVGNTKEYGFGVSTLHDKLTLRVTRYETFVADATLTGSDGAGFAGSLFWLWAIPVWGTTFAADAEHYLATGDPAAKGNGNWLQATGTPNDGPGDPVFDNSPVTAAEKATLAAWSDAPASITQAFFSAYSFTPDRFNWDAVQSGNIRGYVSSYKTGLRNDLQPNASFKFKGPVATVDTLSKGYEIELIAQPIKNWNLSVNASKTDAFITGISPTIVKVMNDYMTWMDGPAGQMRYWGGLGAKSFFDSQIRGKFIVLQQQLNHQQPQIAPWRFNGITTYSFNEGRLKGVNVGGAYRWEQGRILGYQFDPTIDASAGGSLDVNKPIKGSADDHIDLWVGYRRKLSDRLDWRIQLNLRNVGESTRLVPVFIQPDGTVAYGRIQEGLGWTLTNSFTF